MDQDAGQDSFLDIVANLVGILIILVVVVGAQASRVWSQPRQDENLTSEIAKIESEIEESARVQEKWNADRQQLDADIQREMREVRNLANQRNQMLQELEMVRRQIEVERALLSDKHKKYVDDQVQLASLEMEKDKIRQQVDAARNSRPQISTKTIEHYPTPIAKTVFSDEVHFRLLNDRLVYVPLEELIAKMKKEWKFKAEKLERVRSTTETVSEIEGFRMQYQLAATRETRNTRYGELGQEVIQVTGFRLLPTRPELGEPVETVYQPDSDFRRRLKSFSPGRTTISVWVYPESFSSYRKLKNWLQEQGYQSAAWPIAKGDFISGGPNGLRSTAQ